MKTWVDWAWRKVDEARFAINWYIASALDFVVKAPLRAILIAAAVGFLSGAIAVGSVAGRAWRTSYAVPGVPIHAALSEDAPQNAVHFYVGRDGRSCSAVTVAFETLMTAAHCLDGLEGKQFIITKDGIAHEVYGAKRSQSADLAIIYARDAYCPCATVAGPRVGEDVVVVGYPKGKYDPSVTGRVAGLPIAAEFFEYLFGPKPADAEWPIDYPYATYVWQTGQLISGHSGGGMFVKRGDAWFLVAINSWAFPPSMRFYMGAPSGGAGAIPHGSDVWPLK